MKSRFYYFLLLLLAAALTACQASPAPTAPVPAADHLYAILAGGQVTVHGDALRIGAGNIAREPYMNAQGERVQGLRAGLWFFFRDAPENDLYVRVYQGQTIQIPGYVVHVLAIESDTKHVVLSITIKKKDK